MKSTTEWLEWKGLLGDKIGYDCQCSYCKNHLCMINSECFGCTHSQCEMNRGERNE